MTKQELDRHIEAAQLLDRIMTDAFKYISENKESATEFEVQQFIIQRFDEAGLVSDAEPPIVAFGPNTRHIHYFPEKESRTLQKGDLILIDIWAKLSGENPYADITCMGYFGDSIPSEINEIVELVFGARDRAIKFLKDNLKKKTIPTGGRTDWAARDYFGDHKERFGHTLGHSLGFDSPHGKLGRLGPGVEEILRKNVGYTIEPGLYFDLFGARSEIDFYIDEDEKLIITTRVQKKLVIIN